MTKKTDTADKPEAAPAAVDTETVVALRPIRHDGVRHQEGATFDLPIDAAAALIEAGAAARVGIDVGREELAT